MEKNAVEALYNNGIKRVFPRIYRHNDIRYLVDIIKRFVQIVFSNNIESCNTFNQILSKTNSNDIFAILKIFVSKSLIENRNDIITFSDKDKKLIDGEIDNFMNITCPKYLNNLFVNWIDIIPHPNANSRSSYKTKIMLHTNVGIRDGRSTYFDEARDIAKKQILNVNDSAKYFLTQLTYKNMFINRNTDKTYLSINEYLGIDSKYQPWFTFYGLNWLSQLQLFHRYENNHYLLISGETGVGKTSQVPKLLLLAKFITLKYNSDLFTRKAGVYMSVPRLKPADETGYLTKVTMGIMNSDNSIIQIETSQSKYTLEERNSMKKEVLNYKLFTDKKLLLELSKERKNIQSFYDVVIDEAHEHNTNMDLIITYTKNKIENSISKEPNMWKHNKLIIMTATIESDYERLSSYFNLQNSTIEYTFHIEDPQNEVRFKILEKYHPYPVDSETIVGDSVKKLQTMIGDLNDRNLKQYAILLFMPTQSLIGDTIELIYKSFGPEILSIPLYAKINKSLQKQITDLDANEFNYKLLNKIGLLNMRNIKYYDKERSQKRIKVIVATNIAEASITIQKLKGVIETGCYNKLDYIPQLDIYKQSLDKISESSRIQRRGRVGRTSDGLCYYMYPNEYLKDSPIVAEINKSNTLDLTLHAIQTFNLQYEDFFNNKFFYIEPSKIKTDMNMKILKKLSLISNEGVVTNFLTTLDYQFMKLDVKSISLNKGTNNQIDGIHLTYNEKIAIISSIKYNVVPEILCLILILRVPDIINSILKNTKLASGCELYDILCSEKIMSFVKNNSAIHSISRMILSNVELCNIANNYIYSEFKLNNSKQNRILKCFLIGYPQRIFKYHNGEYYNFLNINDPIRFPKSDITNFQYKNKDGVYNIIPSRFFGYKPTIVSQKLEFQIVCPF